MNKIVRDHYPASRLPDELRAGFDENATVRIVIEQTETAPSSGQREELLRSAFASREPGPPIDIVDLLESIRVYKATHVLSNDPDEPVRRIRALRDEWDDE